MAKRIDLRDYQESITRRLADAQAGAGVAALLGFESGGTHWLIDLPQAGEVLPLPTLCPVPLTQPWFAGLTNVHGELQGVIDFSVYCGGSPTPRDGAARLLCIGSRLGHNITLLVNRVHGLKRVDTLSAAEETSAAAGSWQGDAFLDAQGVRWIRLEPVHLCTDPAFLDAVLPDAAAQAAP